MSFESIVDRTYATQQRTREVLQSPWYKINRREASGGEKEEERREGGGETVRMVNKR